MKEILETIIKNLVNNPNSVEITQKEDNHGIILEVKVEAEDMGKVIGKQGKNAKSIRNIMKSIAGKERKKVTIEFLN